MFVSRLLSLSVPWFTHSYNRRTLLVFLTLPVKWFEWPISKSAKSFLILFTLIAIFFYFPVERMMAHYVSLFLKARRKESNRSKCWFGFYFDKTSQALAFYFHKSQHFYASEKMMICSPIPHLDVIGREMKHILVLQSLLNKSNLGDAVWWYENLAACEVSHSYVMKLDHPP